MLAVMQVSRGSLLTFLGGCGLRGQGVAPQLHRVFRSAEGVTMVSYTIAVYDTMNTDVVLETKDIGCMHALGLRTRAQG